jgi:hypothetical protein
MSPDDDAERALLTACERIILQAALLMDSNRAEELVALFTKDCEFVRPSTYPDVAIRGRAEFREVIEARDPRMVSRHVSTNIVARRTGPAEIAVHSYFTHFRGYRDIGSDTPIPIVDTLRSMGEYHDLLIPVGREWQIRRRVARFIFGWL